MAFGGSLHLLAGDTVSTPAFVVTPERFESTIDSMLIKPTVLSELDELQSQGIDAAPIDVLPTHVLSSELQTQVDMQSWAIGRLPRQEAYDTLFDPTVHSAGAIWADLSKRAIALWSLKQAGNSNSHNIAPEIHPSIFDEPMFSGKSAHQVLQASHPRSAQLVADRYTAITTTKMHDNENADAAKNSKYVQFITERNMPFLSSQEFLTGVLDSRAVDTRALAATRIALDHMLANPEVVAGRPLVTASLACGAAAPMFEMNEIFAAHGLQVEKNILVDNDPMALASAVALSRYYGMSDKIDAQLQDIIDGQLTDYIAPHSVDVVDILGIVDYLPTRIMGYKAAANFIGKISDIVRPGGIIVAGNALLSRPHQEFFEKVWPKLQQRDPADMVRIIGDAGYDTGSLIVRVPQHEGVYGVYGIPVPTESNARLFKEERSQRAARKILTVVSKFNRY